MIRVQSVDFATAANNALAFMPAASTVKVARMLIAPDGRVYFTATDMYAAGEDACAYESDTRHTVEAYVSRDALTEFDQAGRKDKKSTAVLTINDDSVTFAPQSDEVEPVTVRRLTPEPHVAEMFAAIDEMLAEDQPFRTAFQPQLLQRFAKVKTDKAERVADLAIADSDAPVLVKIGPSFKGLIMPVSRAVHAVNVGQEGLW